MLGGVDDPSQLHDGEILERLGGSDDDPHAAVSGACAV
jgi:hypothetical protein